MDYTENYSLAMPDAGNSNSGEMVNGNFETIDNQLFAARNILTYEGDVLTYEGDILYFST